MAEYAFVHEGQAFTPNGTSGITVDEVADRNRAIEAAELARWQAQPDRMLGYYQLPDGAGARVNRFAELRRRPYEVCVSGATVVQDAKVTTWLGTPIGWITRAIVYRHNFGGRFIAIRVRGTNGAEYHGRASYDGGTCVQLRKVRRATGK